VKVNKEIGNWKIWLFVHDVTHLVEKEYIYKEPYSLHPNAMLFKQSTSVSYIPAAP
jgi:hypothetical protein